MSAAPCPGSGPALGGAGPVEEEGTLQAPRAKLLPGCRPAGTQLKDGVSVRGDTTFPGAGTERSSGKGHKSYSAV